MPHASYDMRQSKDVSKGKGGKRKKYTTPPFGTLLPAPSHAETHFFRDLLIFLPHQTTQLPPNKQEPCYLLAQVLHFCRLIHACGGLMKTLSSLIVFIYKETVIIIEGYLQSYSRTCINVHYFYLS